MMYSKKKFKLFCFVEVLLKKDMELIVRYLQERLVEDFGYKDDYTIETLQETISGELFIPFHQKINSIGLSYLPMNK